MLSLNFYFLEKKAIVERWSLVKFELLNRVLRSDIFLHPNGQLRAIHVILDFTPISNRFQTSKHVIKARDSHLALVDVAIEGFIGKPPLEGTQVVKLPTFKDPEPIELPAPENP